MNINTLRKVTPRWVIFLIDLTIVFMSIVFSYYLRFNFNIPQDDFESLRFVVPLVLFIRAFSFLISKMHIGLVRYTSTRDVHRLLIVQIIGSAILLLANFISFQVVEFFLIPTSIIIIEFVMTTFAMTFFRLVVKTIFNEFNYPRKERSNVLIYGTDEVSLITKRTIERDASSKDNVIGYLDSQSDRIGKKIEGLMVYPLQDLDKTIDQQSVKTLIIAGQDLSAVQKQEIVDTCLDKNVKVLTIPDVSHWINGELSFRQIKEIQIEELLERDPIDLDKKRISTQLLDKTVLVTGAAGSIGSEIARQISKYHPKCIVLFDQAESPLYDLELELTERYNFKNYAVIIGDVTNKVHVEAVFKEYKPEHVYHAAAYKHVPMMEMNPDEAVRTNIGGTKTIADIAVANKVKRFVMVSTDKAVNPTNIMGASKRIAEIYTQSLGKTQNDTKFITTRFGNVLGSNGSVIPRFQKQIAKGGPITITHPDVTRYFMTIPEACQLVMEAGAMGNGSEIFIFDMGKSVKIINLAKRMIKLSGLELGTDIQLSFTGLRPGEKLYEELLASKENTQATYHSHIMIAKVREYDFETISEAIRQLIEISFEDDEMKIVKAMKTIVPEFISQNSRFEALDYHAE
ncbi:MAG: nucleoside-diphosphate sugar epimerase/dehydratase [Bacteroidota bacterium]|nr:nucleoside-diphosphate sugar epimerase/dehydratase [Bacteroidota bacterium]